MLEFIDYEARSFDCGEYAFAQDAPCGRFGIEEFSTSIAVIGETGTFLSLHHNSSRKREV